MCPDSLRRGAPGPPPTNDEDSMITERSDAAPARTATAGGLSILLAAVVQGWVLYGLHLAIRHET
ncbi:MAG: hypothetical protein DIU71_18230, partial [Proteobacteria bacterium]